MKSRWVWAATLGVGMLALTATALVVPTESKEADDGGQSADSPSFLTPFGGLMMYEPADSPAEVAKRVEESSEGGVVVRASTGEIRSGRTYLAGPPAHTAVLDLQAEEVLAGSLPDGHGGKVQVELDAPPEDELDSYRRRANAETPPGTEGIFYLWRMPAHGIYDAEIKQVPANTDEVLYRPMVQGVYLHDSEAGDVIAPQDSLMYEDASLADFVPSRTSFPQAARIGNQR